jgi:Integrase core domain
MSVRATVTSQFKQVAIEQQKKLAPLAGDRILIRYGMNRLPAHQRRRPMGRPWHRYEKPQPGHRLQIDDKFLERIAGSRKRLYQFTAIDDCTRIRVLKIYDVCNQKAAISFVDEVIRRLPFRVLVVQTDNGAEFQSNFHWHLEEHRHPSRLHPTKNTPPER